MSGSFSSLYCERSKARTEDDYSHHCGECDFLLFVNMLIVCFKSCAFSAVQPICWLSYDESALHSEYLHNAATPPF